MSVAKKPKLDNFEMMYPVLPDDLIENTPRIQVYVDTIRDPKNTSKIVIDLNSKVPIIELTHMKRINSKTKEILLFPVELAPIEKVNAFLNEKQFDTTYLQNNIRIVEVAKIAPKTRLQYDDVQALWPCNFHSNKYLEKLCTNTLFSKNELDKHEVFMKICIDVAGYSKAYSNKIIGAIIVDPKIDSVVAIGFDNRTNNPCQHAVMVAIDNVACTQNGGAWKLHYKSDTIDLKVEPLLATEDALNVQEDEQLVATEDVLNVQEDKQLLATDVLNVQGIPSDVLIFLKQKYPSVKFGATRFEAKSSEQQETSADGPYLCTNYYAYITHEPCIMCAMGLIHSRAKRVFYGAKSVKGGLGSACKIHTVKNLNHHFEVFAGLLEDECLLL